MLNKILAIALASSLVTPVFAADSPFYIGGQISNTTLKESAAGFSDDFDFTVLSAIAGYQFTPFFATELRLGKGVSGESFQDIGYSEKLDVSQQTAVLMKGSVPITDAFSLYGVAGYAASKFTYKERDGNFYYSDSETVDGLTWGVGAGVKFTQNLSATVEYLQMPSEKFNDGGFGYKLKSHNLSLGVIYQF
ncbi:porin family protein [Rheinheimera sp. UJ63]|uniref:porin family protein n=1 Tax=Rheinheimera sp. UJ63 TaxID=2910157 RepID=UPI001F1EA5C2|nr:porin family protein [Rheinheimera sp. UJ63]MCF4008752.1 porin family protein [Rheinheimera sp. UJ63]